MLAPSAHAYQETVWDFRGDIPGRFEGKGLAAPQSLSEGMLVRSATEGLLVRSTDMPHAVESVEIEYASASDTLFKIVWEPKDKPGVAVGIPMVLPSTGGDMKRIGVNVGGYATWNPRTPRLGLGFGENSEIIVARMFFRHYSLWEKLLSLGTSFWSFDSFSGTSVNFLWGPLVATNPINEQLMWDELPPRALGTTWVFMAVAAAALLVRLLHQDARKKALYVLVAALALYELRMGAELLSYGWNDAREYVFAAPGEKLFRTWGTFAEAASKLRTFLKDVPEVTVVHRQDAPLNILQYNLLPVRMRSWKQPGAEDNEYFVLFEYPELQLQGDTMTVEGKTWKAELVEEFRNDLVLYRRLQP